VIKGRCCIGDRQEVVMGFVVRIFIHSKCNGHSSIDSPFLRAQESLNIYLGGCISRPSGFSPSTQCIKPRFKGIHISEIIKNKEIANRRVVFRTRNTSQSIWVRRYSSGRKCILSYFLFKEYKEFLKRRNRRIFPKSKFINSVN
jgi:hypothetical protein